jgi:selenocysteine lyase/cysteine desulfurase
MNHQKHLFDLDETTTYLNGAYMAPQLKSVTSIGIERLKRKARPNKITETDFFQDKEVLRERFAQLIACDDPQRIAIIPSASFGIGTAMHNIPFTSGDEIIVLEEQFPSNFYIWKQLETQGVTVTTIPAPSNQQGRGLEWNQRILKAINTRTKCVAIPHCHWADGTKYDLETIREATAKVNAYLIIDGTQSVGALPFSIKTIQPDALICAGYKWLLGPYSIGVAYYGERFDQGVPLDNNWMNHEGAEDFANLVNYNQNFKPKAARFDIGESSNFVLVPMLSEAIQQLLEWTPEAIQAHCKDISEATIHSLKNAGYTIEESAYRASHLFGIYLPNGKNIDTLKEVISGAGVFVSYRGNAIRISPNVYNTKEDMDLLTQCFLKI